MNVHAVLEDRGLELVVKESKFHDGERQQVTSCVSIPT